MAPAPESGLSAGRIVTDMPASEFADTALRQVYGHRDPVQAGSALATISAAAALAVPRHQAPVMNPSEQHTQRPDISFDGGDLDCGNGPLLLIRKHLDPMP